MCTICISLKVKKKLSMLHFKSEVNGVTFKVETLEDEAYTKKNGGKIHINFSDSQIQKQKFN